MLYLSFKAKLQLNSMDIGKSDGDQSSMLITAPQDGYKTMESTFCPIAFQHLTEHQTAGGVILPAAAGLSGSGRPLQIETVVLAAARAAQLRLRPHTSSMPRAPQE